MPLTALRLTAPKAIAETVADWLEDLFWPPPLSVALIEAAGDGEWDVEAHFDPAPEKDRITQALTEALEGQTPPDFTLAALADRDWVRQSLASLTPVRAGRFFVHGTHDRGGIPGGAISVQIDAGEAFGTGHHETTMGCLLALGQIAATSRPRHILDVGTGSGVLAIAAAKRLKAPVNATDNDPVALQVARANVRANGVAPFVTLQVAHGVRHANIAKNGGYDLIFANILARPLIRLAPDLSVCLAKGGNLVLSGILNPQGQSVLAAYRSYGLTLQRRIQLGDWTTLIIGN